MGYDPFWPVSQATINVLCIPASPLTQDRFNEIFDALSSVTFVGLEEIDLARQNGSGDASTSKPSQSAILYGYSTSAGRASATDSPYEPNAQPQVVIGIYDESSQHNDASSSNITHDHEALQDIERDFFSRYQVSRSWPVCKLLHIGGKSISNDFTQAVAALPSLDAAMLRQVMIAVSESILTNVKSLLGSLNDKQPSSFVSPEATKGRQPKDQQTITSSGSQPSNTTVEVDQSITAGDQQETKEVQSKRSSIAAGTLRLQTGAWNDALHLLAQGAEDARMNRDLIWETAAIERLLLCMTLLVWKGISFEMPDVCEPSKMSHSHNVVLKSPFAIDNRKLPRETTNLSGILINSAPKIILITLELINRATNVSNDHVLFDQLIESRIRLLNFLIFWNYQTSTLDMQRLSELIIDAKQVHPPAYQVFQPVRLNHDSLSQMLIESLPVTGEGLQQAIYLKSLIAVVSALSSLGSTRRHAFLFRDLLQRLSVTFIQARKLGASEVGMHPAAALTAVQNDGTNNLRQTFGGPRTLLRAATAAYGMPVRSHWVKPQVRKANMEEIDASLEIWASVQSFGDPLLKLEILRQCINVCDALPDPEGSLYFTSYLLRSAKQTITVSAKSTNLPPMLSADEQMRLLEGIKKTAAASIRLDLGDLKGEYWDDFLVRDVALAESLSRPILSTHAPQELSLVNNKNQNSSRDPFIFNPFARTKRDGGITAIIAGEPVSFSVLLQNPFEVEIDIDDICLLADGCDFTPSHHSIILGKLCSQRFILSGTATQPGELKIHGCLASIRGCYYQEFWIFNQDWQPVINLKQRMRFGAVGSEPYVENDSKPMPKLTSKTPKPSILMLRVIEPQPKIMIKETTLAQPSIMLLEGERGAFTLSVRNVSSSVPADLLLFTFDDNVSGGLRDVLGRKDILPVDLYEIQYQLKFRPSIKMVENQHTDAVANMAPQKDASYTFDVLGRPGLINASIQLNFAYLGKPRSDIRETFYIRQVIFPLTVTVNGSVEIVRCNIVPISGDFEWTMMHNPKWEVHSTFRLPAKLENCCMLLLDLRNVWPDPLTIKLSANQKSSENYTNNEMSEEVIQETIQPGYVSRVVLLIPRLFIPDPYAPIPDLGTQRQFVVSSSKLSLEAEVASRELFWYREELLKHLSGTWKEEKTGRHGEIDLRKGIRLNPRMIDALKIEDVEISFEVKARVKQNAGTNTGDQNVQQVGVSHFVVPTELFTTLFIRVHNRTKDRVRLLLRLQPSLRGQPYSIALDLSKRLAWSGVLQRALNPPIEPGMSFEADIGIMALAAGEYEINATVEEIKGRNRIGVLPDFDSAGFSAGRRIWHAHSPCLIDAVDLPG